MTAATPLAWTESRRRIALALGGTAVFAALLEAAADTLGHAWWAEPFSLGETFLRLLQPWLLAAVLALVVRELVVRRTLVVRGRWRTVLLHAVAATLFPLLHLFLLALVQAAIFPNERGWILRNFAGLLPNYYVLGLVLYSAIAAAFYAIGFARDAGARERQALALQAGLADARLAALHHQLSPHFLFNALNTVAMLIRQGRAEDALAMLAQFGGLMRDLLREPPDQLVPLAEELDFVRRYLEVEQVRFNDRLAVEIVATGAPPETRVPPLILQPLVENAIRHGIARRVAAGRIAVVARAVDTTLELRVEDDGPGLSPATPNGAAEGVGLANVRARLAQLYGDGADLALAAGPTGGVTATIRLPLRLAPVAAGAA